MLQNKTPFRMFTMKGFSLAVLHTMKL